MQLSERLSMVASMVTAGNCLADVGTDHGYVPIYLYEKQVISHAIAMDVNKGPLEKANLHICEKGLESAIETRLSDGLEAMKAGEAQSLLIAGMGGPLIERILSAYPEVTDSFEELILQPQSEVFRVRRWLDLRGYEIVEEHMIFEDGKYYPMFKAVKKVNPKKLAPLEDQFGRLEVFAEKETLRSFLQKEISTKKEIIERLKEEHTPKGIQRIRELEELIKEAEEMLSRFSKCPEASEGRNDEM